MLRLWVVRQCVAKVGGTVLEEWVYRLLWGCMDFLLTVGIHILATLLLGLSSERERGL